MSRNRGSSKAGGALASSVFWGGMAIGRFTLGPVARILGLRVMVVVYIIVSFVAQAAFRADNPVAVSFGVIAMIGFSFGPMFPAGVLVLTSKLPTSLAVRACSIAASIGQLGGAVAPFFIGSIAESMGIGRLMDLVLVLTGLLLLVWFRFYHAPGI